MLPSVPIHFTIAYSSSQDCSFAVTFALHPCSLQTVRRISLVFHMTPSHFCITSQYCFHYCILSGC